MTHLVALWLSIPPEARGWIEFWLFSFTVTAIRYVIAHRGKTSDARHWGHAFDVFLQLLTASSPRVAAWRKKLDHGGVPDVLLPRVELPKDAPYLPLPDDPTPTERPSVKPGAFGG